MINWTEIIKEIGLLGLLTAAIAWLFKSLGEHFINKRFKYFEKELEIKADNYRLGLDKDLEIYKKELNLDLTKRERLHFRRSEILGELYRRIVDLDFVMKELTSIIKKVVEDFDKEELERIDKAGETYNRFLKYYKRNKIYFKHESCVILDELVSEYFEALWDYSYKTKTGMLDPQLTKKVYERMRVEIPRVKEQIEADFRDYFGAD